MQLPTKSFDSRKVEQTLTTENKFITDLFSILSLPSRQDEPDDEKDAAEEEKSTKKPRLNPKSSAKTRATSLFELQERLEAITSNRKKLSYKEKLQKKGLKTRMKKKNKQDERSAEKKLQRAVKLENGIKSEDPAQSTMNGAVTVAVKPAKPVFNSEGKMVFSKFDFSNIGKERKHKGNKEKDPKKILQSLQKEKEMLTELENQGDIKQVVEIKQKTAWKNALAKAEGQKVRDDPELLKKTVRKEEQKKKTSKKKWEARQLGVEKAKEERQKKRSDNIDKRKQDKKKNKVKKAVKKGRIVPGFN